MDSINKVATRLSLWIVVCAVVSTTHGFSHVTCNETDGLSGYSVGDIPKIFNYDHFKSKFHKSYSPLVSLRRGSLFLGHTIKIFQHNYLYWQQAFGYYLAQNEFTDLTGKELQNLFRDEESELEPVKEFYVNPDAPADSVPSVVRFLGMEEGHSSCAREDLDGQPAKRRKTNDKFNDVKPLLSFMENEEEFPNAEAVLKQLETRPEMAKKISKFVDLKSYAGSDVDGVVESNIKYRPMVSSDNDKYEIQMKPSRAAGNEPDKLMINDGKLYDFVILPYSPPKKVEKSFFGQFFDRVGDITKSVVNFFEFEDPFADEDEEEDEKKPAAAEVPAKKEPKKPAVEYKVDWRKSGCIGAPRHQKLCNSCYAFATLSMLEYYYCKQSHESTSFSPQYLIDCGEGVELKGCDGGKISNTGMFIKKYGLELESMYPYAARKEQCPFDSEQQDLEQVGYIKPQITHWQRFDDLAAWYRWIRKGPIVVGINMPSDFFAYGGGIHDGLGCNENMTHALLLVGFGKEDGREFWLLKNSYSADWGESGYFKLSASAPVRCFNSVVVARVKFNGDSREKVKASRSRPAAAPAAER